MVKRALLVAIATVVVVGAVFGVGWYAGWFGAESTAPPPPPVSPVSVTFGPCTHYTGHWEAFVTNVSSERPYGSYRVSLLEVPTDTRIVTNATVRPDYIGGNGDVSIFYEDNDGDTRMSGGDDLYVGSFGNGPYDVSLYWAENGARVVSFRCS